MMAARLPEAVVVLRGGLRRRVRRALGRRQLWQSTEPDEVDFHCGQVTSLVLVAACIVVATSQLPDQRSYLLSPRLDVLILMGLFGLVGLVAWLKRLHVRVGRTHVWVSGRWAGGEDVALELARVRWQVYGPRDAHYLELATDRDRAVVLETDLGARRFGALVALLEARIALVRAAARAPAADASRVTPHA